MTQKDDSELSVDLLQDRIELAHKISTLEQEMADEHYTPSRMNEEVIPEVANDMNPGEHSEVELGCRSDK